MTILSGLQNERLVLQIAFDQLREGDTFVVWKLERLGRSVKNLINFVTDMETKKIHFKSLPDHIDKGFSMGRFFFHMMASLAQMERALIVEPTHAGLNAARKRSRIGG